MRDADEDRLSRDEAALTVGSVADGIEIGADAAEMTIVGMVRISMLC